MGLMQSEDLPQGFLARPDEGIHPAVVMIHDVWGLKDHTRDLASRLCEEGYLVLAVDLYRREKDDTISDPGAWMRALSDVQILSDVQECIDLLAAHPQSSGSVGITGFCMGGMYALLAACHCRGLLAAVPYYGLLTYERGLLAPPDGDTRDRARKPRDPLAAARDLACPLLAFFGEEDEFIPVEDVRALEGELKAVTAPHEVVLYPAAGHAFMNDTRPEAFRPEVAADAWGRMRVFLDQHLR